MGAFKTSPVESLYAELYETPSKLRCYNLALRYYIKLKADPTNPAHNSTFRPKCKTLFQQKEKAIKIFGPRIESICQKANIPITKIHETFAFKTSPWNIMTQKKDLSLCQYYKEKTCPLTYQDKFQKIRQIYPDYTSIFTDGSKTKDVTCSAAIINNIQKRKCFLKDTSIFSAEIYEI